MRGCLRVRAHPTGAEQFGQILASRDAQFRVDATEKVVDGPGLDAKPSGDVLARQAARGEVGDLLFPSGEVVGLVHPCECGCPRALTTLGELVGSAGGRERARLLPGSAMGHGRGRARLRAEEVEAEVVERRRYKIEGGAVATLVPATTLFRAPAGRGSRRCRP